MAPDVLRRPDVAGAQGATGGHVPHRRLGIWALGMEGDAPAMQAALEGNAPIVKGLRPGPTDTAAPTTTTTTTCPLQLHRDVERGAGDAQPVDPAIIGRRDGSGLAVAHRLHHQRPDAPVPGRRARIARVVAGGVRRRLCRHDRASRRLRGRDVGVHRSPGRPGWCIDHHHHDPDRYHHHDERSHLEHLDQLDHFDDIVALTSRHTTRCALTRASHHPVSWPSQYRSLSRRL